MNMKISRVRKVPQFPRPKGLSIGSFFQLLIGIVLWVFMLILFAIGGWAMWFGLSFSYLMRKPRNVVPWWFSWMCMLLLFPFTVLVILIVAMIKMFRAK